MITNTPRRRALKLSVADLESLSNAIGDIEKSNKTENKEEKKEEVLETTSDTSPTTPNVGVTRLQSEPIESKKKRTTRDNPNLVLLPLQHYPRRDTETSTRTSGSLNQYQDVAPVRRHSKSNADTIPKLHQKSSSSLNLLSSSQPSHLKQNVIFTPNNPFKTQVSVSIKF